ncbi:MAG TPA: nuclear transport factor 2 family protein [Myxococcota bacterium]|nr:nuclear transport factor 2 family protein [Myxococcota bacterium]
MGASESLEVAEKLFAAIPRGDLEAVRGLYAPDAGIWHNHDGVTQDVATNLRVLDWVVRNIRGLRYEEIRRQATPTGFVQQHVLRGTGPSGKPVEIGACIVCTVSGGRITRLDEYLDSAQLAALAP